MYKDANVRCNYMIIFVISALNKCAIKYVVTLKIK